MHNENEIPVSNDTGNEYAALRAIEKRNFKTGRCPLNQESQLWGSGRKRKKEKFSTQGKPVFR
jgi:hypothetical protein